MKIKSIKFRKENVKKAEKETLNVFMTKQNKKFEFEFSYIAKKNVEM